MPKKIIFTETHLASVIQEKGKITYTDLAAFFSLSLPIIRKMCYHLEIQGDIVCSRGYVEIKNKENTTFELNSVKNEAEKRAIAKKAVEFIESDDVVYIGPGTTSSYLCDYFKPYSKLTVVTNSLPVINKLTAFPMITVISLGGILKLEDMTFTNFSIDSFVEHLNIQKVFVGSAGFDSERGCSCAVMKKNEIEHAFVQLPAKKFVLIDHTKFGMTGAWYWIPISQIDYIITSKQIDYIQQTKIKKSNIQLVFSEGQYS